MVSPVFCTKVVQLWAGSVSNLTKYKKGQTRATLAKHLHGLCKSSGVEAILTRKASVLETRVRGHSRSSKVTPFDSLHMVSYYRPIVTFCLKCTVFEI